MEPRNEIKAPATRKHLVGTQWSAQNLNYKHWHVVALSKAGVVTLAATLSSLTRVEIPWRQLRDRETWEPGWQ